MLLLVPDEKILKSLITFWIRKGSLYIINEWMEEIYYTERDRSDGTEDICVLT